MLLNESRILGYDYRFHIMPPERKGKVHLSVVSSPFSTSVPARLCVSLLSSTTMAVSVANGYHEEWVEVRANVSSFTYISKLIWDFTAA